MAETQIKFNGTTGIIALIVVICVIIFRATFMLETKDPQIIDQIKQHLASDVGGALQEKLAEEGGAESLYADPTEVDNYDTSATKIFSVKMSSPLMSFSSKEEVILLVEYQLPFESKKSKEYFRCDYTRLGKTLRFKGKSTVVSYYLNFF